MSFDTNNRVQIGEYNVLIPDKPTRDRDFVNYNKSIDKQKFTRVVVPPDLRTMSIRAQEEFVKLQWHKRIHGEWILVKDTPLYLCGLNWFYLNYWFCDAGVYPQFRVADISFFHWWRFEVVPDPMCYGGLLIKCRREGATERALCEIYEYTSRTRNAKAGIQNMTDAAAEEDYLRILKAHNRMPFFFKPINKGSDKPADGLIFQKPAKRMTESRIQEQYSEDYVEDSLMPLDSQIMYTTTKEEKFDGEPLHRYRQGEWGKIKPATMDMRKRIGIIQPCLHIFNGRKIRGKMLWESTVREFEQGEALQISQEIWNGCDPSRTENGKTKYGMKRLFRSAVETGMPDEFGFPDVEGTRKDLLAKFARFERDEDWVGLSNAQREDPITLDHVFTPSVDQSPFNTQKLKKRLRQLQTDLWWDDGVVDTWGHPVKDLRRRGNFIWQNGVRDSMVIWLDNPNGKFLVSKLLSKNDSNRFYQDGRYRIPANKHLYGFGIDPISSNMPEGYRMSKPAAALFEKINMMIDGKLFPKDPMEMMVEGKLIDKDGKPIRVGDMLTGQFILTYCHRPDSANEFFEDMIMAAVYYGVEMLTERQKADALHNYCVQRGYAGYLSYRPESTRNSQTRDKDFGVPASESTCEQYTQALMNYISFFIDNCKHPELIQNDGVGWLTFRNTKESRTRHDLSVASGWALLAAGERPVKQEEEVVSEEYFPSFDVMNAR